VEPFGHSFRAEFNPGAKDLAKMRQYASRSIKLVRRECLPGPLWEAARS
jgi:hypothetical protein